ncbi:MAG: hypothetical protein ACKVT0_20550 [Planctomycetaceae bacterium]
MNPRNADHPRFRIAIGGGLIAMFVGGCVAGLADGFGDSPPPIGESITRKRIGVSLIATGAVVSLASAVALYVRENKMSANNSDKSTNTQLDELEDVD